jgi:hypothetical protein
VSKLDDLLSEDTNQFGPGTDLTISLLAVMMVMTLVTAWLYRQEIEKRKQIEIEAAMDGGNFKLASEFFSAADFKKYPVTELANPSATLATVGRIAGEYARVGDEYPWIFVIGHSSRVDDREARDRSPAARRERNWSHAGRRASVIAGLLHQHLGDLRAEKLVVVTTGELDLKRPREPASQENAFVEVVFGKDWKPASRNGKVNHEPRSRASAQRKNSRQTSAAPRQAF